MMKHFLSSILIFGALFTGCKKSSTENPDQEVYKQRASAIRNIIGGDWHYQAYEVKYYGSDGLLMYDDIKSSKKIYDDNIIINLYGDDATGTSNYRVRCSKDADSLFIYDRGYKIISYSKDDLVYELKSTDLQYQNRFVNTQTGVIKSSSRIHATTQLGKIRIAKPY